MTKVTPKQSSGLKVGQSLESRQPKTIDDFKGNEWPNSELVKDKGQSKSEPYRGYVPSPSKASYFIDAADEFLTPRSPLEGQRGHNGTVFNNLNADIGKVDSPHNQVEWQIHLEYIQGMRSGQTSDALEEEARALKARCVTKLGEEASRELFARLASVDSGGAPNAGMATPKPTQGARPSAEQLSMASAKGEVTSHATVEPAQPVETLSIAPPPFTATELELLKEHVAAHPWLGRASGMPAVDFIAQNYKEWLKRGLPLEVLRPLQKTLAAAYSTAISRDPSKAVKGLYVAPHKLPADAPLPVQRSRRVADLPPAKAQREREQNTARTSARRQAQRIPR